MRLISLLLLLLFVSGCATGMAPEQNILSYKSLDLEIKGTLGYTTLESPAGTIDYYFGEYDSSKLPSSQVGFRLKIPLSIKNHGENKWLDPEAKVKFTITDPVGERNVFYSSFNETKILKRIYVNGEEKDVLEFAGDNMLLLPSEKRVFYFDSSYVPKLNGLYIVDVELVSLDNINRMRVSRSSLTFEAGNPNANELLIISGVCSAYRECGGTQVCCSLGVDVPVNDSFGHCADSCGLGEIEIPYLVKLN